MDQLHQQKPFNPSGQNNKSNLHSVKGWSILQICQTAVNSGSYGKTNFLNADWRLRGLAKTWQRCQLKASSTPHLQHTKKIKTPKQNEMNAINCENDTAQVGLRNQKVLENKLLQPLDPSAQQQFQLQNRRPTKNRLSKSSKHCRCCLCDFQKVESLTKNTCCKRNGGAARLSSKRFSHRCSPKNNLFIFFGQCPPAPKWRWGASYRCPQLGTHSTLDQDLSGCSDSES